MKFDDLLAQYLYEYRKLDLQEIGTFELDKSVIVPQQTEKEIYHPIEGLRFTYNLKATTTEDLISYLVKRLGKIHPLVSSDIDSYLSNIRQFINIGKPYTIDGIGTLQFSNHGGYEFTPGYFLHVTHTREENQVLRERAPQMQTSTPSSGNGTASKWVIALVILLILAGIGWGFYKFMYKPSQTTGVETSQPVAATETLPDTSRSVIPAASLTTDTLEYKMIFETTSSRQRAYSRTAYLKKLNMPARMDSVRYNNVAYYRMFIPVVAAPSDTLRIKDSLYRIFAKKIIIQK